MGDRTYVSFAINGHITTISALDAICSAAVTHGMSFDGSGFSPDADAFKSAIGAAAVAGENSFRLWDEECNYANLDALESACRDHGIAYQFEWDAGCDYSAGIRSFDPVNGLSEAGWDGTDPAIALADLQAALSDADPMTAVRRLADVAVRAAGFGQPVLTVSEDVLAHLTALA